MVNFLNLFDFDLTEHLDTPNPIVDHPAVVIPKHIRGRLGDVLHNANLSKDLFEIYLRKKKKID